MTGAAGSAIANGVPHDRVLVLIPAYNESASLPAVVAELRAELPDVDILVVDDASTDRTAASIRDLDVRWVRLPTRLGTGAAVRTGIRYAAMTGYRRVVRVDGDGQHPPQEIPRILRALKEEHADAAIGSRYKDGHCGGTRPLRKAAHRLLGMMLSAILGQRVTDATSGLWAFGPRAIRLLAEHHPSGYPEPELLLLLNRNGLVIVEVPVTMRERLAGRTSLTPQRTGAALARLLLLMVVVPLRQAVGRHDD